MQTRKSNNPTYKDILNVSEKERSLWEEAMVKEFQNTRKLDSFKMIARPRGAIILQSTWDFKKKRYPDGALKKFKANSYVQGDQHVDGVDVFETYAPVVV